MIKLANTTATAITAGQVIPLNLVFNTNDNFYFNGLTNEINVRKAGLIEALGMITLTATQGGAITVSLYNNGVEIPETRSTFTFSEIGQTETFPLIDAEKVVPSFLTRDLAKLTVVISRACTLNNINLTIKHVK